MNAINLLAVTCYFISRMRTNPNLENGHFPGQIPTWKMTIFQGKFQPGKRPFSRANSTRKMTIFHPEKSHAWKKAIFRVEFFFKKFFTGLENGQNHPRNSKFHAFDLELLKNPRAEKNLPRKMAIFHAWDLKIFSCEINIKGNIYY